MGPMHTITYNVDEILAFIHAQGEPGVRKREMTVGMGWCVDGQIVAGAVFESVGKYNGWIHAAADRSRPWATRTVIRLPFIYAFRVCGLRRLSATVRQTNHRARRFVEHLGFWLECRLEGAAEDGSDLLIYVMWKEGCRHVDPE